MKKLFLAYNHIEYTYDDLFVEINRKTNYSNYVYVQDNDPFRIFVKIIHSLLYNYPIEILDGDFSAIELEMLGIVPEEVSSCHAIEDYREYKDVDEVIQRIKKNNDWKISLYTSGTTGRPKKVSHTLATITRNVKENDHFRSDVWAFCYNPTHIAGIQVFFQALFNFNSMIYAFGENQFKLEKLTERYRITNISATATYYRMVLSHFTDLQETVRYVTFGGEKFDPHLIERVLRFFPNAKVRNIYASTEGGSLFSSYDDTFRIEKHMEGLVKISEGNELCIHSSMLGNTEQSLLKGDWYYTGDIVEQLNEQRFRIISRGSEMLNVGGYKVNPLEVEAVLLQVPGVIDVVVKGRDNKVTGQIIVAEVIKQHQEIEKELTKAIKAYASEHLQSWKVPRLIIYVDQIVKTRTGKKGRT